MKKNLLILIVLIGIGFSANAQLRLSNGKFIYLERKYNGVGPASGVIREYLNDINWPYSIEKCAEQHDYAYGTYGKSQDDADRELKNCIASISEFRNMTLREFIQEYGNSNARFNVHVVRLSRSIDLDTNLPDVFYLVMQYAGNSWKEGQSLALASMLWNSSMREEIKKHIQEAFGFTIANEEDFGRKFYIAYQ
jgi:hypothetical protein